MCHIGKRTITPFKNTTVACNNTFLINVLYFRWKISHDREFHKQGRRRESWWDGLPWVVLPDSIKNRAQNRSVKLKNLVAAAKSIGVFYRKIDYNGTRSNTTGERLSKGETRKTQLSTFSLISQKLMKISIPNFNTILRDIFSIHLFTGSGNRRLDYFCTWFST